MREVCKMVFEQFRLLTQTFSSSHFVFSDTFQTKAKIYKHVSMQVHVPSCLLMILRLWAGVVCLTFHTACFLFLSILYRLPQSCRSVSFQIEISVFGKIVFFVQLWILFTVNTLCFIILSCLM